MMTGDMVASGDMAIQHPQYFEQVGASGNSAIKNFTAVRRRQILGWVLGLLVNQKGPRN